MPHISKTVEQRTKRERERERTFSTTGRVSARRTKSTRVESKYIA